MNRTTLISLLVLILLNGVLAGRKSRSKKIINGLPAAPHTYPYHATIVNKDGLPYCGGAIIDKHFILTAAHCKTDLTATSKVIVGGHNIQKFSGTEQVRPIAAFEIFKGFKLELIDNDIGLIYVEKPFEFNKNVQKIKMSSDETYPDGQITITGYGYTKAYDLKSIPETMQKAVLDIQPYKDCKKAFPDFTLSKESFCYTKKGNSKMNTCGGDSGGPVVKENNGKFELIGVHYFGSGTCTNDEPSVANMVAKYSEWIEKKMKEMSKQTGRKRGKKSFSARVPRKDPPKAHTTAPPLKRQDAIKHKNHKSGKKSFPARIPRKDVLEIKTISPLRREDAIRRKNGKKSFPVEEIIRAEKAWITEHGTRKIHGAGINKRNGKKIMPGIDIRYYDPKTESRFKNLPISNIPVPRVGVSVKKLTLSGESAANSIMPGSEDDYLESRPITNLHKKSLGKSSKKKNGRKILPGSIMPPRVPRNSSLKKAGKISVGKSVTGKKILGGSLTAPRVTKEMKLYSGKKVGRSIKSTNLKETNELPAWELIPYEDTHRS